MKKSRIFSALLVLALLSTCVIGGTFAKYTSTATGTATATVAKWSFKVGTTEIANLTPQTITFNLFETINESDTTTAEGDVAAGKIAPGTGGQVAITVENTSEVTAKYKITFAIAENTAGIPLEFSADGGSTWKRFNEDLSGLYYEKNPLASGATDSACVIKWRWAFDGASDPASIVTDAYDTELGIAAQTSAPTITVSATVVAEQVD